MARVRRGPPRSRASACRPPIAACRRFPTLPARRSRQACRRGSRSSAPRRRSAGPPAWGPRHRAPRRRAPWGSPRVCGPPGGRRAARGSRRRSAWPGKARRRLGGAWDLLPVGLIQAASAAGGSLWTVLSGAAGVAEVVRLPPFKGGAWRPSRSGRYPLDRAKRLFQRGKIATLAWLSHGTALADHLHAVDGGAVVLTLGGGDHHGKAWQVVCGESAQRDLEAFHAAGLPGLVARLPA